MKKNQLKKSPSIGYMCSYVPYKILTALGFSMVSFFDMEIPDCIRGKFPTNLCSYVRTVETLLEERPLDAVIITNCCNAMQRLYDYIRLEIPNIPCFFLELPKDDTEYEQNRYYDEMNMLIRDICSTFGKKQNDEIILKQVKQIKNRNLTELKENSIYVLSSALSPKFEQLLLECITDHHVVFHTCKSRDNGDRMIHNKLFPHDNIALEQLPCARVSNFNDCVNKYLQKNKRYIKGIIYLSTRNCTWHLFQQTMISKMSREHQIPVLCMEESYNTDSFENILTRVEAFEETIGCCRKWDGDGEEGTNRNKEFTNRLRYICAFAKKMPLLALEKTITYQTDLFQNVIWSEPDNIVWTNMAMTTEILYAAGLVPVNIELIAGWLATFHLSEREIKLIEKKGVSNTICSYYKAALGLLEEGGLPIPKSAVVSSRICDEGPAAAAYLHKKYGTDSFSLNIPFDKNEQTLKYVMHQYKDLIHWIENYTKKSFDYEKLKEALRLSNEARKYWLKVCELRKGAILYDGYLSLRNFFGVTFLFGSQQGVDITKTLYLELQQRKERKEIYAQSGKRILWIHFAPIYNNQIIEYFEQELKCWIVYDITGYIYWDAYDLEHPIESLAKRSLSHFYYGNPVNRIELYKKIIQEYKIDGVVHFMHMGCQVISGAAWQIRSLAMDLNIPYLELSGDCIDPRGFSLEQVKTRLEAFQELLNNNLLGSNS